ncbi:MAG TPA: glutaredoxin family protein [Candidatus Omnitrophota bacterium]|nr:glutaredoxin family protein [Candidatus Omnitrophota bacterium]HRZ14746.1 glutaredoxin family protein [Candidatus Omnitrophota bacterium]
MKTVKVFALSTCPWCKKTKQFFQDRKIPAEFFDYDLAGAREQEELLAEMERFGGGNSFPLVLIGEEAVEGYDPDQFCDLLEIPK